MEEPRFFGLGFKEEAPALLVAMCGNGVKEEGEECDAEDGVPGGYECTDECVLRKLPEAPAEEAPPVEEAGLMGGLTPALLTLLVVLILLGVWYYVSGRASGGETVLEEGTFEGKPEKKAPSLPGKGADEESLETPQEEGGEVSEEDTELPPSS
jgi:hypothetical protein